MAGSIGRPEYQVAWNNVDLDVPTLLSFERPLLERSTRTLKTP
jgi:hypothetical protein